MPDASPLPPHAPPSQAPSPLTRAGAATPEAHAGHRRVRAALYAAFAVLAMAMVLLGLGALRMETLRASDVDILDGAGLQRVSSQQVGRVAAMIGLAENEAERDRQMQVLQALLHQSALDALKLKQQLDEPMQRLARTPSFAAAPLERWQAERENLGQRAHALLLSAKIGDADVLRQRVAAVQAAADGATVAAQQLSDALRHAAELRAESLARSVRCGVGGMLVLLGLLGLLVMEPSARAVHQQWLHRARDGRDLRLHLDPRPLHGEGSACPAAELPALRTLARGEALRNETLGMPMADGTMRWLLVNTEPQRDTAHIDALTRLPNRAVVMERLQHAIEHARRNPGYGFAVLFFDFDPVKQVNDTLGHSAGDELLRQIARRLRRALRPGDAVARLEQGDGSGAGSGLAPSMAARLGGEQFVAVLDGMRDVERVSAIAQRLLADLSEPYTLDHAPVQSSVSIGVVLCADLQRLGGDEADVECETLAEDVLRNADTAMYEAKRSGRDRWVLFNDSMHERVMRTLEVEGDLRRALKGGELFVVYQPVVELASRRLSGVEALVRWRHPQRGLVPPVDFISVAEECGLIDAVGGFVLETACRQFMQWRQGLGDAAPKQLAVNVSRAQLQRGVPVDDVRALLQATGMAAAELQLEVTESLAAQDERVQATLRELKALGVGLALDDFGTGYSSLTCLHQMPVDTVKVDRSFVKHAETVEYHRVLIEATIRVAHTMGMTTVAEGIETEGQAELMRTLTCDHGQGDLFSHPLEAADLQAWALARAPQALAAA